MEKNYYDNINKLIRNSQFILYNIPIQYQLQYTYCVSLVVPQVGQCAPGVLKNCSYLQRWYVCVCVYMSVCPPLRILIII